MNSNDARGAAAGDYRRALVLIQHGIRGDEEGLCAIIDDDIVPSGRLTQVSRAAISILWQLAEQLLPPEELGAWAETLELAPVADEVDPQNRLVARLATAHRLGDQAVTDGVFRAAGDLPGGLIHFTISAAAAVPTMLPQLRTPEGQQLLADLAIQAAGDEGRG